MYPISKCLLFYSSSSSLASVGTLETLHSNILGGYVFLLFEGIERMIGDFFVFKLALFGFDALQGT